MLAFAAVPGPPAEPEVCNILSTSCTVKYELPADEGDAPVTGYHVQCRVMADDGDWETVNETPITDLELVVDQLKPLSQYQFRVAAENQLGKGKFSQPSQSVTCLPEPEDEINSPSAISRSISR